MKQSALSIDWVDWQVLQGRHACKLSVAFLVGSNFCCLQLRLFYSFYVDVADLPAGRLSVSKYFAESIPSATGNVSK